MRTIEAKATVTADGRLSLQVPSDIQPGEHRVVVVMEEQTPMSTSRPALDFPVDSYGPWPADLSLRREDMYDDDGR